ncbi:MAG: cell division ATP-binding protein FtsE [Pseudomonadales bacterium]|nr:cell division ATP-binding protein FtsE [Pseudomonadales bacterium]
MIRFNRVTKRYQNGHNALDNVSFSIERGQMVFLTGHSGAGKSTLLRLISLLDRPTTGSIEVDGVELEQLSNRKIPLYRRGLGVVFQEHRLLFDRSVFENVALPLRVASYSPDEIRRRVQAALDRVSLLSKENLNPQVLSGGEQQRVGIARAIVNTPSILLADEPTGNLDPKLSEEVMGLFQQFNQFGTTVLVATHDLALVDKLGNPRLQLEQGQLVV